MGLGEPISDQFLRSMAEAIVNTSDKYVFLPSVFRVTSPSLQFPIMPIPNFSHGETLEIKATTILFSSLQGLPCSGSRLAKQHTSQPVAA